MVVTLVPRDQMLRRRRTERANQVIEFVTIRTKSRAIWMAEGPRYWGPINNDVRDSSFSEPTLGRLRPCHSTAARRYNRYSSCVVDATV